MLLRFFFAGTRLEPNVHDRRDPIQPCQGGCGMRSKLQMFGKGRTGSTANRSTMVRL